MRLLATRPSALLFVALLATACGTESPTQPDPDPDPVVVATVRVSPDSASVTAGATRSYAAQTLGPNGESLTGRSVAWTTDDAAVATVDGSTGMVTGVDVGTTVVTAASEGVSGSATVVVTAVPVASVVITPESVTLDVADTASLTAQTFDASGGVLSGRAIAWTSLDSGVATVDPASGFVNAVAEGATSVVATSESEADTASVVVQDVSGPTAITREWRSTAASTDWADADNWLPRGVPYATDTVLVQAGANQPVLTNVQSIAALQIAAGASLQLDGSTLSVIGDVEAGGTGISGSGTLSLSGSGTFSGSMANVRVFGTYSPTGTTAVTGELSVSGTLDIGPEALTVEGDLIVQGSGALVMMDAAGLLDVDGNATFQGRSSSGLLTAGTLRIAGDVTQSVSFTSRNFAATDEHTTILDGAGAQSVSFADPVNSHFAKLTIAGAAVTLSTPGLANGDVELTAGSSVTGTSLQVLGALTTEVGSSITLSRLSLGSTVTVDGAFAVETTEFTGTAQAIPTNLDLQEVVVSGSALLAGATAVGGNLTLSGFGTLEVGAESLTVAADLSVQGSGVLVMTDAAGEVDVLASATFQGGNSRGSLTDGTLRVGGGFTQIVTFHPSNFVATDAHTTVLNGAGPQTVSFGDPAASRFANLMIADADVTLSTAVLATGDVDVATGSSVAGTSLRVQGSLSTEVGSSIDLPLVTLESTTSVDGAFTVATTEFAGTAQAIQPGLEYEDVLVSGGALLAGATAVDGSLTISGSGTLGIGAEALTVTGDLDVQGAGVLVMTDAAGEVDVLASATFQGGNSRGSLTAGTLRVGGDFTQIVTFNPSNFSATGTHTTELNGASAQTVSFGDRIASRFANLVIAGTDVTFSADADVLGSVILSGAATVQAGVTLAITTNLFLEAGSTLVNDGTINVGGSCTDSGATVSGTGGGNVPCVVQ